MIKEKAAGLAEPARSSFMWIPEGTQVHKADISYWITEPWDNYQGRLTLTGDAAHPMPPCRYCFVLVWKASADDGVQTAGKASIIVSPTFPA